MTERITNTLEYVDENEMEEANSSRVGTGTPATAPHEPVKLTLWERLSRRFPKIEEK
jgi:hypothetical protein